MTLVLMMVADISLPPSTEAAGLGARMWELLRAGWEILLGPWVRQPLGGGLQAGDLLSVGAVFAVVWGLSLLLDKLVGGWARRQKEGNLTRRWTARAAVACGKPLQLLLWWGGGYVALSGLITGTTEDALQSGWHRSLTVGVSLGVLGTLGWLLLRLAHVLEEALQQLAAQSKTLWDDLLVSTLGRGLKVLVPVVGLLWALPLLGVPSGLSGWFRTGSSLVLVGAVGWMLIQIVHVGQRVLLNHYDLSRPDNLAARKVYTQVKVLTRILYVFITILTVASALMLFEEVRRLGTTLLASAGVLGIMLGFAAQRTVANLFAGFQLALTQPIRVDDVVIVEGEWGRIEEINLTYVVVRIWDDRRLIVPLSYFIERPFQNWTRTSAEILGSVFVWVDDTVPVAELWPAVQAIVASCPDWDGRFWNLQVTDATDRAVQLRVLATAADASKAWNLRCEIREKMIAYLQAHYPGCLPRVRAVLESPSAPAETRNIPAEAQALGSKPEALGAAAAARRTDSVGGQV